MNRFISKIRLAVIVASMFVIFSITSKVSWSQTPVTDATTPPTTNAKAQITGPGITGNLKLRQDPGGFVWVYLNLQGDPAILTPGLHGFHIHQTGSCQEGQQPPFISAGGHFDPGPYGNTTPVEANHPYHLGDLPNAEIDETGRGKLSAITTRFTLSESPLTVFDSDGSAVIVHALTDQMIAGGTAAQTGGPRLACGVIEPDSSSNP